MHETPILSTFPSPGPLKALIVAPDPRSRQHLRLLLRDGVSPAVEIAGEATPAQGLAPHLQDGRIDLVMLDLGDTSACALAFASELRRRPAPPAVILVSEDKAQALQAFDLDAADFLAHPVRRERLQQAVRRAALWRQARLPAPPLLARGPGLLIHSRGRAEHLPLDDVLYVRAELKYLTVRTARGSYLMDGSLHELEARHGGHFVRIHRNTLVARGALGAVIRSAPSRASGTWTVHLAGIDEALPVSRRQLPAVRLALAQRGPSGS